jgi:hypothetical protein
MVLASRSWWFVLALVLAFSTERAVAMPSFNDLVGWLQNVTGIGTGGQGERDEPYNNSFCFTNLTDVFLEVSDDRKINEKKRFVICPNTTVDLGFLVPGVGITNGDTPLIPRSNTEYLCGVDGKCMYIYISALISTPWSYEYDLTDLVFVCVCRCSIK